jgi:hypothetical protein
MKVIAEHKRLVDYQHRKAIWKKGGPYLRGRAWGTVTIMAPWEMALESHCSSKLKDLTERGHRF